MDLKCKWSNFRGAHIHIGNKSCLLDECVAETIGYCKDRTAFGRKIIENQSIHFKLAELKLR